MKIVFDAVGIRDGGGLALLATYMRVLPLARPDWIWEFCILDDAPVRAALPELSPNACLFVQSSSGWLRRFTWLNHALPRHLKATGADVLFSFANLAPLNSPVPNLVFVQQLKAFDTGAEDTLKARLRYATLGRYLRRAIRNAASLVVQTAPMGQHLIKAMAKAGIDSSARLSVIPSPVQMPDAAAADPSLRQKLDHLPTPRLLYVSLARAHKNHARLLQAFATLRQRHPNAQLLLTVPGPGTQNLEPFVENLHQRALDLNIHDAIVWLGVLDRYDISAATSAATFAVFPSQKESFGLPLVEAMMSGLPLACADLPYAHEVCGTAAIFFDPENPADIADALNRILDDPALFDSLKADSAIMAQTYDPTHLGAQLCQVIEQTAHSKRPRK